MQSFDLLNISKQYELIQESSLLRRYDATFQQDIDKITEKFKMLVELPATQQIFERAKTEQGKKYLKRNPENCFKVKMKIRSGVQIKGEKSYIMIKIYNAPQPNWGNAMYDPNIDSIVFSFYLEGFVDVSKINDRFNIKDWYTHNATSVNSKIAHELSHLYKTRFHMRGSPSRSQVVPQQVASGDKNSADYAMYDDEKESYLAQIWQEMLNCNTNEDKTYHYCLLQSQTFKKILRAFGVSSHSHRADKDTAVLSNVENLKNLDKDYKKLYDYFMKKTYELWEDKGFKFNDFADQMYTHKLQQFATSLSKDKFDEFSNEEKIKALKSDIEIPLDIFKSLEKYQKEEYVKCTPTMRTEVFTSLSHSEQQEYTLQRYRKIVKDGIKNDLDVVLLRKNKRLYDIVMLPEVKKAKKQEEEIRSKVKNSVYEGDVDIESKYVLPNLKDVIISGNFNCSNKGLTTLQGSPKGVIGDFDCTRNNLKTLEFSPNDISGNFDCSNNNLGNLAGAPRYVERSFQCTNNNLKTLENGPKVVDGDYHAEGNNLEEINTCKTKLKGIFFSNQFTDSEFKSRKQQAVPTVTPTFKQFIKK